MTHPVADMKSRQIQARTEFQVEAQTQTQTRPVLPQIPTLNSSSESIRLHASSTHHHKAGVLPALQSLLHLIVIAIFIITFCAQPFRIPSESMESTLLVGDFLLVDKQTGSPDADGSAGILPSAAIHRGDIVVFHDPRRCHHSISSSASSACPATTSASTADRVFINGHPLSEPYAVYRPSPPDNFRDNFPRFQSADPEIDSHWWIRMRSLIDNGELIIPTGNYFVMGDNRNDSEDSRYWGFVPREAIVGKPLLIYFSLQQHDIDDATALTQDALADQRRQHSSKIDSLVDFARWGRTFQVVR